MVTKERTFLFVILLIVSDQVDLYSARTRHKRDLVQLCDLITQHTNSESCLDYNDDGCFCGYGWHENRTPLDPIDNCCYKHDLCYGTVNCRWVVKVPQLRTYSYVCEDNQCRCTDSRGFWSVCARDICQCDLEFGSCLRQNQHHYNQSLKSYEFC